MGICNKKERVKILRRHARRRKLIKEVEKNEIRG